MWDYHVGGVHFWSTRSCGDGSSSHKVLVTAIMRTFNLSLSLASGTQFTVDGLAHVIIGLRTGPVCAVWLQWRRVEVLDGRSSSRSSVVRRAVKTDVGMVCENESCLTEADKQHMNYSMSNRHILLSQEKPFAALWQKK